MNWHHKFPVAETEAAREARRQLRIRSTPLAARMSLDDRMTVARFLDTYGPDTVLATIAEIRQSKQQRDKADER